MKNAKLVIQMPIVAALALLCSTAADDNQTDSAGAPPSAEQKTEVSTSQPAEREKENASADRQKVELNDQQKNQQSIFAPNDVDESQLKQAVTEVNKASSFIGMQVQNLNNEKLGKVHDLVFDPKEGRIAYVVLSIGGLLGIGDKLIAVPITSLEPRPGQDHLVLDMNRQKLESAPGLAQNNWPNLDAAALGGPAGSETTSKSEDKDSSTTEESGSE